MRVAAREACAVCRTLPVSAALAADNVVRQNAAYVAAYAGSERDA